MAIKVQKVKLHNFKVIKDLEKEINGKSIFLTGENGIGKSSFMQAIKIALGNSDVIPTDMTGEGVIDVTKDGQPYSFAFKTGKDGKPKLTVTLPNGLKEDKKGIIGGLVGAISFDINEFVKLSESTAGRKKQVQEFKKLLPQEFILGIEEYEKKAKNIYDDRTEIGRKIDTLEGFIKESKLFGSDLKTQPVDVSELNKQLEEANAQNAKIKEVKERFEKRTASLEERVKKIEQLKAELVELERVQVTEETTQKEAAKWIEKNQPIDTSALIQSINSASETNVLASKAEEHNNKLKQLEEYKEQYGEFTVQYEVTKQAIADAIRDFDSPVEGLSFDDEKLLYNGVPVDANNLSTSEIIHLGVKMMFASNPESGLIFIEHANEIGSKRLKEIMEYAEQYDLQLFFEEVRRGQDELQIEFVED
jgi:predicted ATP-dependent endonuclease of OLD family